MANASISRAGIGARKPTCIRPYQGLAIWGRVKYQKVGLGNRIEYDDDDRHNLTSLVIRPRTGAESLTWTYAYTTDFNLLSSVTDPPSRTTTLTYDASGQSVVNSDQVAGFIRNSHQRGNSLRKGLFPLILTTNRKCQHL